MESVKTAQAQSGGAWIALYGLRELVDNLADGRPSSEEKDNLLLAKRAFTLALDQLEDGIYHLANVPAEG